MTVAPPAIVEARGYGDRDVQRLVAEVQQEYVLRYGGPDDAVVEAGEFDPPNGLFLVGLLDGRPVATGGWRRLHGTPDTGEIKRMYVVAAARRRGIARLMLAALEASAARAGLRRLILNTGAEQPEAVALYAGSGYEPVPGFGVYADAPRALFFGKQLAIRP